MKSRPPTAIRQAKIHGTNVDYILQKVYQESVLVLEEERWAYQAFVEAFGLAMGSCSPECWGALLYPLQLLTGDIPLAVLLGMLATAQLQVTVDKNQHPQSPSQECQRYQHHQQAQKCQCCSSDQGVPALRHKEEEMVELDYTPKEHPH